jgi:preprotein translocase subunit SecB
MDYPIELKNIFFTRSIVVAVHAYTPNGSNTLKISPANNLEVKKIEDSSNQYTVTMTTLFNQESESTAPYMIDMECIAVFLVDENISKEETLKRLSITGHSVVYGAIREAVSWITSRQPYGPLNLGLSILNPIVKPSENPDK